MQPAVAGTRWRPSGDMGSETACKQLCTGADRRGRLRRRQGSWGYVGRTAIRPRPPGSAFVRSWARAAARTGVNPGLSRPAAPPLPCTLSGVSLRPLRHPGAAAGALHAGVLRPPRPRPLCPDLCCLPTSCPLLPMPTPAVLLPCCTPLPLHGLPPGTSYVPLSAGDLGTWDA